MSAVKLNTAGGGSVLVQPASSIASDVTVNVPSQNCTLGIQGPAFSAYTSGTQSVANNTYTKLLFTAEKFDTNNNFASSTFTPTVAGYYQINARAQWFGATYSGLLSTFIYKNGSVYVEDAFYPTQYQFGKVSDVIYMNGTTDYLDVYVIQSSGSANNWVAITFSGFLVRAA